MLLSWRKPIRVGIGAHAIGLLRGAGKTSASLDLIPCEGGWQAGLDALADKLQAERGETTFVLSSQFVRYAVLPWKDELADQNEWLAYAQHTLLSHYGLDLERYTLRLSPQRFGMPVMAAAIENTLLAAIEHCMAACGGKLGAVEPYLMSVFNAHRGAFTQASFWLCILEADRITVARINDGAWTHVAVRAIDQSAGWQAGLETAITRELLKVPGDPANATVYLHGATPAKLNLQALDAACVWLPVVASPPMKTLGMVLT